MIGTFVMKELKQETRITMTLMFNKFTQPFFP